MKLCKYIQSLTRQEFEDFIYQANLTDEELEIVNFMCKGLCREQIAEKLMRSVPTIDTKIKHIKGKLERMI